MKKYLNFLKAVIICLFLASVCGNVLSANKKGYQVNQAEKIFYASRTAFVRVEPDKDANIVVAVKQGERLEEIGHYDLPGWIKVKLSNGEIGWIPKSVVATTIEKERGKWEIEKEKDIHKQGYAEKSPEEKKIEVYIRQIKEDLYSSEGGKAYNRLVKIGRPAIIYLVRALKDEEIDHFYRSYYAEILGKIGDPSAIPALIEALKNEEICRSAANALGDIGDETAIPDLIKVILSVPYKPDSYFSSYTSYGSCAGAAANALGKIGRPAVPPLVKILQRISNPLGGWSSKDYIVKALGATRDKSAIPPLIELLQEKHCGVAVEALGIIGDKSAVPALIKVLKSEDKEGWARAEAATSLGKIADKSSIPVLIEALGFGGQDSIEIRKASAVALGEIGDKSAIPVLAKKAEEGTWSTWGHSEGADTRRALSKIVYKQNSSTLLSILKNKNLENCYRFWELVLSSLYEKNGPAVISIYKRLKNEVNNRHLKETITEKIEKVNLELGVKRDLSGSLIKYAVEYRKCLKQFRFLEYQLKYKTTSDKFEIRTKELQSFVKTKFEPVSKKFSYAMGVYSEKYGAMKLRDFAITHGFLDLLK
ncbi:hypothetical protein ES707_13497 [subsurface metagenome]